MALLKRLFAFFSGWFWASQEAGRRSFGPNLLWILGLVTADKFAIGKEEEEKPSLVELTRMLLFSRQRREASGVQGAAMSPLVAGTDAAKCLQGCRVARAESLDHRMLM